LPIINAINYYGYVAKLYKIADNNLHSSEFVKDFNKYLHIRKTEQVENEIINNELYGGSILEKLLKHIFYPQGFNLDEVSCGDLAYAHALGYLNMDLYFLYCLTVSLSKIFLQNNEHSVILNIFGVKEIILSYSAENLLEYTRNSSFFRPVLFYTNYRCLYYSDAYKDDSANDHILLVTGYNPDTQIVIIQDFEITEHYNTLFTSGQIFHKARIPEKLFVEIIEGTNEYLKNSAHPKYKQNAFVVVPIQSEVNIPQTKENVLAFYSSVKINGLQILDKLVVRDSLKNEEAVNRIFRYYRKDFLGSVKVIVKSFQYQYSEYSELIDAGENFMQRIDLYISVMHKAYLKNTNISNTSENIKRYRVSVIEAGLRYFGCVDEYIIHNPTKVNFKL
jgi:hypothetical protein